MSGRPTLPEVADALTGHILSRSEAFVLAAALSEQSRRYVSNDEIETALKQHEAEVEIMRANSTRSYR